MGELAAKLEQALKFHQNGDLVSAETFYRTCLEMDPTNELALYFLGLIFLDRKEYSNFIQSAQTLIRYNPDSEYIFNLAETLYEQKFYSQAIEFFEGAIELNSNESELFHKLGLCYYSSGKKESAVNAYSYAVKLKPNDYKSYYHLGIICAENGMIDNAIIQYSAAIEAKPDFAQALLNLGVCFDRKNDSDNSLKCYQKAANLNLAHPMLFYNLGNSYFKKENYNKAINSYKKAIELNPNYAEAYNSIGTALHKEGKLEQAAEYYKKALELNPNDINILNNLGAVYKDDGKNEEAKNWLNKILDIKNDAPEANYNLGTILLSEGNFKEGWPKYEARFKVTEDQVVLPTITAPQWSGYDINGKKICVLAEQGFGDSLMFSRYLNTLTEMGAHVSFNAQPQLSELFKENFSKINIIKTEELTNYDFDYHVGLLSIPGILNANESNIPNKNGWLKANEAKVCEYKKRFFENKDFKVGIFWQGNTKGFKNRALKLIELEQLFNIDSVKLYSFQKDYGIEQLETVNSEIINLGKHFESFSDTAAAIENLDLMITIDSGITHLCGAMGKPTWVMLPFAAEWRWQQTRDDSIWYSNTRLFRQPEPGNWNTVVSEIKFLLNKRTY